MNLNKPEKREKSTKKNYHTTMDSKLCFLGMTMYHFLSAMVDGPGYLPLGWKPKEVMKLYEIFYYLNTNMYCICQDFFYYLNKNILLFE